MPITPTRTCSARSVGALDAPDRAGRASQARPNRGARTFAGHYIDVDDQSDLIGAKAAEGAVAGAAVGILAGPLGIAVGFVAGGMIGGEAQAHVIPALKGAFFDELRADVPENSSGVVLLANPDHVDAMVAAFEGHHGGVVRHQLTSDEAQVLVAAVANTPLAAPGAGS